MGLVLNCILYFKVTIPSDRTCCSCHMIACGIDSTTNLLHEGQGTREEDCIYLYRSVLMLYTL